jgi:hypothetical protein
MHLVPNKKVQVLYIIRKFPSRSEFVELVLILPFFFILAVSIISKLDTTICFLRCFRSSAVHRL